MREYGGWPHSGIECGQPHRGEGDQDAIAIALLHGATHHTAHDPLLGEDVDDEHRGHGHEVAREGLRVVRGELRAEHILRKRDRLVALIGEDDGKGNPINSKGATHINLAAASVIRPC